MAKLKISTRLRSGIKDVEGDAILKKLHSVNLDLLACEVGQVFYIDIDPVSVDINKVCDILVNDLLYDYTVEKIDA